MNQGARKICVVTGSRADYGLLKPVIRAIDVHPELTLQLAVTGSHLEARFGHTIDAIHEDGFRIDTEIPLSISADDSRAISHALARAVSGFGDSLAELEPDMVLVLGDRYEILGVVQAALINRTPVAHIAGGDVTTGAFDDAIRHAITKMSHLHFVTNDMAASRVRQLGEADDRIFVTGSPGIDQLLQTPPLEKIELEQRLGIALQARNLAITFHPATAENEDALEQLEQLLRALDELGNDVALIFTGSNADPRGQAINKRIQEFVQGRTNSIYIESLGQQGYYSLLAHADVVVGNSSSGLYEAPSFKTPTVNIGDRQSGRIKAASVIDCPAKQEAIAKAITQALELDCSQVVNPYGDGKASQRIVDVLAGPWQAGKLIHKVFIDRVDA